MFSFSIALVQFFRETVGFAKIVVLFDRDDFFLAFRVFVSSRVGQIRDVPFLERFRAPRKAHHIKHKKALSSQAERSKGQGPQNNRSPQIPTNLPTRIIRLQLPTQFPVSPVRNPVEQLVETRTVVLMHRVAQLVNNNIVYQVIGQAHQVKAQRYIVARRATAPLAHGVAHGYATIFQAQTICQLPHPRGKQLPGFGSPCLLHSFAGGFLHLLVGIVHLQRICNDDAPMPHAHSYSASFPWACLPVTGLTVIHLPWLENERMGARGIWHRNRPGRRDMFILCYCPPHPPDFRVHKLHRLLQRNGGRYRKPHSIRRAHRKGYTPGATTARNSNLSQLRMVYGRCHLRVIYRNCYFSRRHSDVIIRTSSFALCHTERSERKRTKPKYLLGSAGYYSITLRTTQNDISKHHKSLKWPLHSE